MKRMLCAGITIAITSLSLASPIFYWGSTDGLALASGDVYYHDGSLVSQGSDWLVELVNVADDSVLFSLNDGFLDGDGLFYADAVDAVAWNGLTVKTLLYNNSVKSNATYFAEFTSQYTFSWGAPPPPTLSDYDAGYVTQNLGTNPGEWQVIPEPTVAALIGIFGSGLLISRRIFAKA